MIVEITDEVFARRADALELYQLFRLALCGRHILLTNPIFGQAPGPHLRAWLGRYEGNRQGFKELLEYILQDGIERDAAGPSPSPNTHVVVTLREEPRWDKAPFELPLEIACRLAETPLRALVENRRNDGAFLLACAPPELRERLEFALVEGWLEFVQGGGLTEIHHRVRADGARGQELTASRLWIMFDSDARARFDPETGVTPCDRGNEKWGPSRESQAVLDSCRRAAGPLSYRQLRRRSIENYAPGKVLEAWAGPNRSKRRRVSAFLRLDAEQRHYFNMKSGLEGDRRSGLSPIYDDIDDASHRDLGEGFKGITDFFHEKHFDIKPEWFTDGQHQELREIVSSILAKV